MSGLRGKTARSAVRIRKNLYGIFVMAHKWLYILLIPGVLYMLIFNYLPMFGIVIAFQDFWPSVRTAPSVLICRVNGWDWRTSGNFLQAMISLCS